MKSNQSQSATVLELGDHVIKMLAKNFLDLFQLICNMTEPETPAIIPSARPTKFTEVTTLGNACVTALAKVVKESPNDPEVLVAEIRKNVPEVLQLVVTIIFEKSKLWSIIDKDDNLKFYQDLKFESWVTPDDLNASALAQAKVKCSI